MTLFAKVRTETLEAVARDLSDIHATAEQDIKLAIVARTLAVYCKCELARRHHAASEAT